jgi:hypothetical protein
MPSDTFGDWLFKVLGLGLCGLFVILMLAFSGLLCAMGVFGFYRSIRLYQPDMNKVLSELRDREFKAGRFCRSELKPKNFDEAIRNADAAGTRSILDIEKVSPTRDIMAISPAPAEKLKALFATDKPSHAMIEGASKKMPHEFQVFLETYDRGEGVYIIIYEGVRPSEIYIAGWSCH